MSIAKLTSIRTVIRITCETLMANWLLWPRSRSPVVATWPKRTRVYFTGTRVNSPSSMQTKPKPKKTTCNTSQLSNSIRSKESKGSYSNLRYLDSGRMSRHHGGHHNERLVRRTHSVCVALVPGWESLKIRWLNYHHCHCPHWSLIYAHCGRKSMSPLSNTPTCIWICTDFFPTHPVFFLNK